MIESKRVSTTARIDPAIEELKSRVFDKHEQLVQALRPGLFADWNALVEEAWNKHLSKSGCTFREFVTRLFQEGHSFEQQFNAIRDEMVANIEKVVEQVCADSEEDIVGLLKTALEILEENHSALTKINDDWRERRAEDLRRIKEQNFSFQD
jgi:hypothetical protein